jgi:hypothetical protein
MPNYVYKPPTWWTYQMSQENAGIKNGILNVLKILGRCGLEAPRLPSGKNKIKQKLNLQKSTLY